MRLKYVAREFDERLGAEVTTLERLSVSQYRGVIPSSENSARIQEPSSYEKYKVVQPGDLVLNRFNAYKGALGISSYDGVVSPDYMTVKLDTSRVDIRYIEYFLKSVETSAAIKMSMSGMGSSDPDSSAFSRLDKDDLFNLLLPITDLETQRSIADYLDKEISEMDTLIEEFERLVKNLEDRHKALITERLFPRGSESSTRFKPLRLILREKNQRVGTSDDYEQLSVSHTKGVIPSRDLTIRTMKAESLENYKTVEPGDLVLNRFNAYKGALGISPKTGAVSPDYMVMSFLDSHLDRQYVEYWLRSEPVSSEMKLAMGGMGSSDPDSSAFSRLDKRSFFNLRIPYPPIAEQRQIADELDREFERMDALIEESTRLIENLKARKTALITEVVTGRKEV